MRILIVSSFLPYPLLSGGQVRLFNIIKELSQNNEITLVCEMRRNQTQKEVDEIKKFCKNVFTVQRKKQWSPQVIFTTAISSLPFLLAGHKIVEMKNILVKLLQEEMFDIIHVETFYVLQNVPKTTIPIVLIEHNIEYRVYQRFVDSSPLLLRPLLQIDVEKIKYWEKKAWNMVSKVVGVSEVEAKQMRSDAEIVPNGVNLSDFPFKKKVVKKKNTTILFMGNFKWIQNRDSVLWIIKDIWPKLLEKINGKKLQSTLWIVGKHIPESVKKQQSSSIIFDEHASDKTSDIYKKSDLLLSPIRIGGGTSYKILEAMASGVPVVTTKLGIEGISSGEIKIAVVADGDEAIADKIVDLMKDKKLYETIRKNARTYIEDNLTWKEIVKKLEKIYEEATNK